jgi:DNA processing protein
MARGIDTAAHQGSLESGTLAVMGGGVDVVYPKQNADLYEDIIERGVVIA